MTMIIVILFTILLLHSAKMKVTEWMIMMWLLVFALVFGIYGKKPIVKVQEYSLFEYCFPSTKQYNNPFNFSEVDYILLIILL